MDFLSKVHQIKDNISLWQEEQGNDFKYLISEFPIENEITGLVDVCITKKEHEEVIEYLASTGFLEITAKESSFVHIKIFPERKPTIRLRTLKLIAEEIGNLDNAGGLINFLVECGVDKRLIVYPETKWQIVETVLVELACSRNPEDKKVLFKIIGDALHPVIHGGDTFSADILVDKFKDLLSYDNLAVSYDEKKRIYKVTEPLSADEINEIMSELDKEGIKQFKFLCQPENKEKISLLRKTYQTLMGTVEVFCRNYPRLSHEEMIELNKFYLALDKTVGAIIYKLQIGEFFENYSNYPRPFKNLFSAEKELGGDISWNKIRQEMSARFGQIETLYQRVNASDILAEPDKQKWLNDVTLYLSELKEKTKIVEQEKETNRPPTARIEIAKIPELQIKGFEEIASSQKVNRPRSKKGANLTTDSYEVSVNDREIWINDYLIAKPHAVGSNYEFFEYIRSQPVNKQIKRKGLSDNLQEGLSNKAFFKILNALGFKGEIKKAFFYKVDADTLCYRGDKLTLQQLKEAGINTKLFIKELETADAKYNPD